MYGLDGTGQPVRCQVNNNQRRAATHTSRPSTIDPDQHNTFIDPAADTNLLLY